MTRFVHESTETEDAWAPRGQRKGGQRNPENMLASGHSEQESASPAGGHGALEID